MKTVDIKTLDGVVKVPENVLNMTKGLCYTKICNKYFGYFQLEPELKLKYIYRAGGYNNITLQTALGVQIPKNITIEEIEYATEEILSITQLLKEHDGYKSLSISEDTLGEHGCYNLEISGTEIRIILWRHFIKSTVFKTTDMKKAIKEISTKYYRTPYEEE